MNLDKTFYFSIKNEPELWYIYQYKNEKKPMYSKINIIGQYFDMINVDDITKQILQ